MSLVKQARSGYAQGMAPSRKPKLVRYVSPFGSPAWMPYYRAMALLNEEDPRWVEHSRLGVVTEEQRQQGGPRIEHVR